MVEPHNAQAAELWGASGADYDGISFGISDALAHAAQRLWPRPGERILDIATGTGWTARNAARFGARVTAVDFADDLLAGAQALSAHVKPEIDFQHADAEALPFDDASFDGVISTFGMMFAPDHARAAAEAARVCKPGGRLVVTSWDPDPDGYIGRFFALFSKHADAPPPEPSPLDWGRQAHVATLLGDAFDLTLELRVSCYFAPSAEDVWAEYRKSFGPARALLAQADDGLRQALEADFLSFHREYDTPAGLVLPRAYLLTSGVRK